MLVVKLEDDPIVVYFMIVFSFSLYSLSVIIRYLEEYLRNFQYWIEVYLEPCETSVMESFLRKLFQFCKETVLEMFVKFRLLEIFGTSLFKSTCIKHLLDYRIYKP